MEEILTTNEATKYLKIDKRTLLKMIHEGKIRAMKVGNTYRIRKEDLIDDLQVSHDEQKAASR